ncbi:ethanolamine ammonia-lyase subunit EutC [Paenibacillus psychroresistens]|uniref:Ethanolamine ammonia-lyase small subunit n=1 Tax=Paenibacillus psychroresistens TaxID=1778678 RepID=A0A6B8REC1_9BACL|nr:ethanolamine ammonia-lyase subunit EutC [Paenibacillus psychroresistens]QGQ93853.1 ethanolamine ammonia-lyase subunit EutC [Paenibacillus psychroresistens]
MDKVQQAQLFEKMTLQTPARIGVGRTGTRPLTEEILKLRLAHAQAVDSVYGEVSAVTLEAFGLFAVNTMFGDKETYLKRPDRGRVLTEEAGAEITERCVHKPQVQIVISDGLSAKAVDDNLPDILPALIDSLAINKLGSGTPFFVRGGRVGCMDDIGRLLEPEVLVLLIGERPGLEAAASMSAYMCYQPRPGKKDSDRMVISNIHRRGTPPIEAGAHIGTILRKMIEQQVSGVNLIL